ncbi:hypothetical protein DPMN_135993 [Dreissena polymorpha]|uniref:Uncharacterized protein n=1 Tax=Dreissena polymorpha TaxID=45954 RepID=A0A9D4G2Z6_DREPO|nr:hypothetical protein DPMN_135993 [Dreissena polymorpha]
MQHPQNSFVSCDVDMKRFHHDKHFTLEALLFKRRCSPTPQHSFVPCDVDMKEFHYDKHFTLEALLFERRCSPTVQFLAL